MLDGTLMQGSDAPAFNSKHLSTCSFSAHPDFNTKHSNLHLFFSLLPCVHVCLGTVCSIRYIKIIPEVLHFYLIDDLKCPHLLRPPPHKPTTLCSVMALETHSGKCKVLKRSIPHNRTLTVCV